MKETIFQWFNRMVFGSSSPNAKLHAHKKTHTQIKYVNRHAKDRKNVIAWMKQDWKDDPTIDQLSMAKRAMLAVKKGQLVLDYPKSVNTLRCYSQYADPLPRRQRLNRGNLKRQAQKR